MVLGVFGRRLLPGLTWAAKQGFTVVPYRTGFRELLTKLTMKEVRSWWSDYELDGVVVAPTIFHYEYPDAKKPKGIFAFKENDLLGAAQTTVLSIIWQKARTGRWTPKIKIKPTPMDGVVVEHATAHNAKWMMDRGLGPGAVVKVLRSGGVVPKIVGVVKPVDESKFVYPDGNYKWEGVHMVDTNGSKEQVVRSMHFFLKTLGVKGLAENSLEALYDANVFTSVNRICSWVTKDSHKLPHALCVVIGKANGIKAARELEAAFRAPKLKTLITASQKMGLGIGELVLAKIEAQGLPIADALTMDSEVLFERLVSMRGFKETTARKITKGMTETSKWLDRVGIEDIDYSVETKAKKKVVEGPLNGIVVSWTTYRDKDQEAVVTRLGGVIDKWSSKTTVLLWSPKGKPSTKVEKAGPRAMTWDQFVKKYKIKE